MRGWTLFAGAVATLDASTFISFLIAAFNDGLILQPRAATELPDPGVVLLIAGYLLANVIAAARLLWVEIDA